MGSERPRRAPKPGPGATSSSITPVVPTHPVPRTVPAECEAARHPRTLLALTAAWATAGALLGEAAAYAALGPGRALAAVSIMVASIAVASIGLAAAKASRQRRRLEALCRLCTSRLVYLPRRFTYTCSAGERRYACYSSAEDRAYIVEIGEVLSEEPVDPWEPLDFYCVKPLQPGARREGRRVVYRGELFFIDPYRRVLLRSRGSYVSGPPEELLS